MDHLPRSPGVSALCALPPEIFTLPVGSALARIWFAASPHPSGFALFRHFGPTASRFDHHLPGPGGRSQSGDRGILYAVHPDGDSLTLATALAEVFQDSRLIDLTVGDPHLAIFRSTRDLALLDLTGHWTTKAGAHAGLSSGPRKITREWSRDFYDAYPGIEGLRYRSAMSGGCSISVALFERARTAMPPHPLLDRSLADPSLLEQVTNAGDLLGYQVVP